MSRSRAFAASLVFLKAMQESRFTWDRAISELCALDLSVGGAEGVLEGLIETGLVVLVATVAA